MATLPRDDRRAGGGRALRLEPLEDRRLLAMASLAPEADTFTQSGAGAGGAEVLDVRDANGPGDRVAYVRFDLSGLTIDQITSATFSLYKTPGSRSDTIVTERFDVYGLTDALGATPQDWSEATLAEFGLGAEYTNTGGDGLDTALLFNLDQESGAAVVETVENVDGAAQSISGADLVEFLNQRVDDDGLVTFVTYVDAGANRGWGYSSRENADPGVRPSLVIEYEGEDPPSPDDPVRFTRQVEKLDRGVVAVRRAPGEAYVGWRLLGSDPEDVAFNVYRRVGRTLAKLNDEPLTGTTDFVDTGANFGVENIYFVRAVVDGVELADSRWFTLAADAPVQQHLDIPLTPPPGGFTPDNEFYSYNANDASVGDLDGDGRYEVILKWDPTNSKDNSQSGYTGNVYVDAYTLDGERLWRIDLGRNIRAGAHYTQMTVYDLDGDGRSEVVLKTAPGTVDGQGNYVLMGHDDPNADYRNSSGYVLSGPEYLTVFDGLTGAEVTSIPYEPARGAVSSWGDTYGNRVDRFLSGVAYLDGVRPSVIIARGYYGPQSGRDARNEIAAYDFRDGQLTERWIFKAATNGENPEYLGQGSNAMSIGDVDGDGYDEIIYGAAAIDHDGTGLYSTGLGHGDALHMSDMLPSRPGQEVFMVHESPGAYESDGRDAGGEFRDAATGELLFQIPSNNDVGRGVAMDIDPNSPGYEMWATTNEGQRYVYSAAGEPLYETPGNMMYNFGVWWDADLSRELLDGTTISDWLNPGRANLVSWGSNGINSTQGLDSNNGTKSTPALSGDILGDWREEVIWRRADNSALEIWTTTIPATSRMTTLMHDTQYRVAIDWQNVAYNQPPHPSFHVGEGMAPPPRPTIYFGGELRGDYNQDGVVDNGDFTVWRDTLGSNTNMAADGDLSGRIDAADYAIWREYFGSTSPTPAAAAAPAVSESTVADADATLDAFVDVSLAPSSLETEPLASAPAAAGPDDQTQLLLLDAALQSANDSPWPSSTLDSSQEAGEQEGDDQPAWDVAFESLGDAV